MKLTGVLLVFFIAAARWNSLPADVVVVSSFEGDEGPGFKPSANVATCVDPARGEPPAGPSAFYVLILEVIFIAPVRCTHQCISLLLHLFGRLQP
jgi:hypothetical protein